MQTNVLQRIRELDPQRRQAFLTLLAERGADFDVHPLSPAQRRLWLAEQIHPGTATYNVPYAFGLTGELDPASLRGALADLAGRHEMLRTVFLAVDGDPRQLVLPVLPGLLEVEDHTGTPVAQRAALAATRAAQEASIPFDLSVGPLLRARLLRFDATDFVLLLTFHHIVCDGWSMRILFQDLEKLYLANVEGRDPLLGSPALRYTDFARWETGPSTALLHERQLRYWRQQLDGAPAVLELPADRPRPVVPTANGGIEWFSWPPELSRAIDSFCRAEGVTPFVVALAAFNAVLHRYSGQDDIVVGVPVAGRRRVEIESIVGFFVNMLPIRTRLDGQAGFRSLVRQTRDHMLGAQENQDVPFEALVEFRGADRSSSYHPMFQVLCVVQDGATEVLRLPGLGVRRIASHSGTAKFDLSLVLVPGENGLDGSIEYNRGLFDAATVRRMTGHLGVLLQAALAEPDRPLRTISVLRLHEQRQLLHDWNQTGVEVPCDRLAYELIENQADATPGAPAVTFDSRPISYAELDSRANQLAHHLRELGVGPEALVGIFLDRSVDLAVCALAVWKAGGAYLPLDPAYPADRLSYMVGDAQLALVLTESSLCDRLRASTPTVCVDATTVDDYPATRLDRTAHPDNLAYVIYTSGSSGRPKGVMIPHRGLVNLVAAQARICRLTPPDRVLQFASFSFDASVFELLLALTAGAQVIFAPRHALQPGADLARTIRENGVSVAVLPPAAVALMSPGDVPSLRILLVAGETCPREVASVWAEATTFYNAYGPTEATIWATVGHCVGIGESRVPIGRPLPNTRTYVLDELMQPVPVGVPGQLYLGGTGITRGYLRRPDLTAQSYLPDPFGGAPGERLYCTGDLVRYREDGQLEFLGRTDGQVKIRGLRVELGEIQALLAEVPAVRTAIVTPREYSPGDTRLVAYVVAAQGHEVRPAQLRATLRQALPEFMVPSAFVAVDALPQSPNGKIDYRALAAHRPPTESALAPGEEPVTELERAIAAAWQDILKLDRVGTDHNFFDLGGNSLLITKLRGRLEHALGREISTLALFRFPTVHTLAEHLSGASAPPHRATGHDVRGGQRKRALLERSRRRAVPKERGRAVPKEREGES